MTKRYVLYAQLNEHNQRQLNERYTHYTEWYDARELIEAANKLGVRTIIVDTFTDKAIWKN